MMGRDEGLAEVDTALRQLMVSTLMMELSLLLIVEVKEWRHSLGPLLGQEILDVDETDCCYCWCCRRYRCPAPYPSHVA